MDKLKHFRRSKKDAANVVEAKSSKLTPPDGNHGQDTMPSSAPPRPQKASPRSSPFRGFHLRSGKRARSSPPASLPLSPPAAPVTQDGVTEHAPSSPSRASARAGQRHDESKVPQIPAYLNLTEQEINKRFNDLNWKERDRLMQSLQNRSPEFRWAGVTAEQVGFRDRYANVQPWNNNRVKLRVPPGHGDYINASPIIVSSAADTSAPPNRYIAMQGPTKKTAGHVWRMVTEQLQSPSVMIMLTETHEGQMEKCFPYFPRQVDDEAIVNEHDEFGDGFKARIKCVGIEETPAGDAIELRKIVVRILRKVQRRAAFIKTRHAEAEMLDTDGDSSRADETEDDAGMQGPVDEMVTSQPPEDDVFEEESAGHVSDDEEPEEPEERVVWHFLYKKWPDFGVPDASDLESFFTLMRLSREKNAGDDNPRIVHCSAGIGRTGTFISLEHLMQELQAGHMTHYEDGHEEDLVFNTVNQLREQRRQMVQAAPQYAFIYKVMRKLWQDKYGSVDEEEPAAKRLEVGKVGQDDPFREEDGVA